MSKLKLDEIGYWSEIKLDIIKKYAQAYSTIMNTQPDIRAHLYIDGFAVRGFTSQKTAKNISQEVP